MKKHLFALNRKYPINDKTVLALRYPVFSFLMYCGTPLTFMVGPDADELDVTVCSFDQPATVTPADHVWVDGRLPWIHLADDLPVYGQKRQTHAA